jgi:hypothetical protein
MTKRSRRNHSGNFKVKGALARFGMRAQHALHRPITYRVLQARRMRSWGLVPERLPRRKGGKTGEGRGCRGRTCFWENVLIFIPVLQWGYATPLMPRNPGDWRCTTCTLLDTCFRV